MVRFQPHSDRARTKGVFVAESSSVSGLVPQQHGPLATGPSKEVAKRSKACLKLGVCQDLSHPANPERCRPDMSQLGHEHEGDDGVKAQRVRENHPLMSIAHLTHPLHPCRGKNESLAISSVCGDVLLPGFLSLCPGVPSKFSRRV